MKKMQSYKALEIAEIINGDLYGENVLIDKLSLNSKEKAENWCFFAIKGPRFNGNDFIEEAIKNGARLIISDEIQAAKTSVINVKNTVLALGLLAKSQIKSTQIIGVTGSVGKTTTKEMIISVLRQKFKVCGTYKNQNNEIGVPLTLFEINGHDFCVVEMGMRAIGEIDYLASICRPECVVITNVGSSHLEKLKSKENIFLAKTEILNYSPKMAILPNEKRFKSLNLNGIHPYFINDENCYIYDYKYSKKGIIFSIKFNQELVENIKLKSFYFHNMYNALIAFIIGKQYGISSEKIKLGIEAFHGEKMREEYMQIKGITVINDCYNSSFESVKSALISLKKYCEVMGKKTAVLLGDMLEIGCDSEKIHEEVGSICNKLEIKTLFAYGKYAENIIKGYGGGIILLDKNSAKEKILSLIDKNDVLLVKGSRDTHLEEILMDMERE